MPRMHMMEDRSRAKESFKKYELPNPTKLEVKSVHCKNKRVDAILNSTTILMCIATSRSITFLEH